MKPKAFLLAILVVLLYSACGETSHSKKASDKVEIPKALNESKVDVISPSRSSREGNLVNEMYDDLKEKTPELNNLAESIDAFRNAKADSIEIYQTYKGNIERYYSSADDNLTNIEDSVLRSRLRTILAERQKSFKQSIVDFEGMKRNIAANDAIINDYYEALKIEATLPLIAKYQKNNRPDTKPVKVVTIEGEHVKQRTIELAKKYGEKL